MLDLRSSNTRLIADWMSVRSAQLAQALLLMGFALAALPVWALDLSDMSSVYVEDFEGESSFPTTPETDIREVGGLVSPTSGNGPPAPPALVSGAAVSSLTPATGGEAFEQQNVVGVMAFAGSVAIRGSYSSYASAITGSGHTIVLASLTSSLDPVQNVVVSARLGHLKDAFGATGEFLFFEIGENDVSTSAYYSGSVTILGPTAISALFSGAPFEMDLRIEPDTLQATGSMTIGAETFTSNLELQTDGFRTGTAAFLLSTLLANCDFYGGPCLDLGQDDSHDVSFDRVEVFVPEPATTFLQGAALMILMGLAARRRS